MKERTMLVRVSRFRILGQILLSAIMLIGLGISPRRDALANSDAVVSISPATTVISNGNTLTVNVVVEDAQDLGSYEFSMAFDSTVVQVVNVVDGGFLGSTGRSVFTGMDTDNETLHFEAFTLGGGLPAPDGDGTLAVITLEAVGVGTSDLNLFNVSLVDGSGVEEAPIVEDGVVDIEPCEPPAILDLASSSPVALGETMHFTATVSGSEVIVYAWGFGGAGTATDEDTTTPTFVYDAVGTYTATLDVENFCGTDQEILPGLCVLLGDFNGDNEVSVADVALVADDWHCQVGDPCYDTSYDLDGDDEITVVDIMLVAAHWGDACE